MAKREPPAQVDHFEIRLRARSHEVGPVIAFATRLGIESVDYALITDVHAFAANRQHDVKAEDFLAAWITDHPTFKAKDAVKHFRDNGRTDGACYSALRLLVDKGSLTKLSSGNYSRADVKAVEDQTNAKAAKPVEHERTGREEIERFIRNRKSFTLVQLRALFREQGRNEVSVSPLIDKMLSGKVIKRIGDPGSGEYALAKRPATKPKKKPVPAKAVVTRANGSEPPAAAAEVNHG